MEMVDLKMPKSKPESMKSVGMPMERDQYPYGTRITLDEEQLAKMGDLFENANVDEEVTITATGCFSSKRSDQTQGGKKNRGLSIQIKKINVACNGEYGKGTMDDFMKKRQKK